MACKLKAMGWVDWLHWWVRWSTASHIRHSRRATWTLVGATRVPLWSHLAADVSLGNRRRQCFRGQRQLLWYADSTPCWSQDHSLPSALTLNDAVAYPARDPCFDLKVLGFFLRQWRVLDTGPTVAPTPHHAHGTCEGREPYCTGWIGDDSSCFECRMFTPSEALSVAPMHHWAQYSVSFNNSL